MRIGIVSESYYPAFGGIAEHVHNLARALRERGHTVKVISTSYGEYADAPYNTQDVIRVGRASMKLRKNGSEGHIALGLGLGMQLKKIFRREQFDIVHVQSPEQPMLELLAVLNSPTVTVGTFHAQYDQSLPLGILRPIVAHALQRLHGRIAVSSAAKRSIQHYFPEGEYAVIPNGVNVERFTHAEPLPQYADRPNLLFIGNFAIRKGFIHVLDAYLSLKKRWPNLRLLAVGDGTLRNQYEQELGERAGTDVIFTGRVSTEDLPRYYASATVFCAPATGRESFGIVLAEAMAAGVPIVASNIDGYRAVVGNTHAAILVPPGNAEAIDRAVDALLHNPAQRAAMSAAGRKAAVTYQWSAVAERVEAVYEKARAAYPATVPIIPGWRWLYRSVPVPAHVPVAEASQTSSDELHDE